MAKEANPACFVVLGGPHATYRFHEILTHNPAVDAVVLGEGEETFVELVNCLAIGSTDISGVKGIAFRRDGRVITDTFPATSG